MLGNEVGHPRLLGLEVADADALLPSEVAAPWVRRPGAQVARQPIARVHDVVAVDEEAAGLAVVGPDVKQVPVLVEDLDAAVAAVGHVHAPPRVDLDVVGIAEAARFAALRSDAAPDGEHEASVARELHDAVVAAPVAVRHPDVPFGGDRDPRGAVEVGLVVPVHPRFPDPHHHFALPGQLEDLVAHAHALAQRGAGVSVRPALRHPEESLVVEGEAVRKGEEARPEALHQVPVQVELEDRVDVGARALVGAAAVEDPEVRSVGVGDGAAHDPEGAALREMLPPQGGPIGVGGGGLGGEHAAERPRAGGENNRKNPAHSMCVAHVGAPQLCVARGDCVARGAIGRGFRAKSTHPGADAPGCGPEYGKGGV